jgi:c(7)-type cytochrome triheme protein
MSLSLPLVRVVILQLGIILLCGFAPARKNPTIVFNHSKHLNFGLDCTMCHGEDLANQHPEMPKMMVCADCHDGADPSAEAFACTQCHTDKEFKIVRTRDAEKKKWDDISSKFNHNVHVKRATDCTVCHSEIMNSTKSEDNNYPKRANCGTCHDVSSENGYNWIQCTQCHDGTWM